jgi:hypothetical protein
MSETAHKVMYLLKNRLVKPVQKTFGKAYFQVGHTAQEVTVTDDNDYSCTCKYYSLHMKDCSHIRSVRAWIAGDDLK